MYVPIGTYNLYSFLRLANVGNTYVKHTLYNTRIPPCIKNNDILLYMYIKTWHNHCMLMYIDALSTALM